MAEIKKFVPIEEKCRSEAEEKITEKLDELKDMVAERGIANVSVVAVDRDDCVIHYTTFTSRLQLMGALHHSIVTISRED